MLENYLDHKLGSKLKYLNILIPRDIIKRFNRRKMS